jgi:hypothetical protein
MQPSQWFLPSYIRTNERRQPNILISYQELGGNEPSLETNRVLNPATFTVRSPRRDHILWFTVQKTLYVFDGKRETGFEDFRRNSRAMRRQYDVIEFR